MFINISIDPFVLATKDQHHFVKSVLKLTFDKPQILFTTVKSKYVISSLIERRVNFNST